MFNSARWKWAACIAITTISGASAMGQDEDPSGARIQHAARRAIADGRFLEATELLRGQITDPHGPVVDPAAIEIEVMRRIRRDYSLTPERMLEKIRAVIPDVTAEDVETWTRAGGLQHRVIDGAVCYFQREPSNLLRFCPDARERWLAQPHDETFRIPDTWRFPLTDHVKRLVALGEHAADPEIHPLKHAVTYTLTIRADHPRLKPGAKVRCWLPFPQAYRQQKEPKLITAKPAEAKIAPEGHPQRTVYMERTIGDETAEVTFQVSFEFIAYGFYPHLDPTAVLPYDQTSDLFKEYTAERPPHIVFTKAVRRLAREITGEETNPLRRARVIFNWVCEHLRYCSEVEYSTIPNIGGKGLATGKGDCGVQAMVLITLCRAAGVPARWQSGWTTMPRDWNMHDWAEVYVAPWGWLPVDPSYGLLEHEDPRVREFYLGHLDPHRLIVNLDYGRELEPKKISFRSEPNDFQRGEIEIDGHNLYYDEWDWDFEVRTTPLEVEVSKNN